MNHMPKGKRDFMLPFAKISRNSLPLIERFLA